ncbi:MAG: hypothetical protein QXK89_08645 [Candidatus Bathyarchaeia archaeon]
MGLRRRRQVSLCGTTFCLSGDGLSLEEDNGFQSGCLRGTNLLDPESVKIVIAAQQWSVGRKENAVIAYSIFPKNAWQNMEPPKYRREETLPRILLETE